MKLECELLGIDVERYVAGFLRVADSRLKRHEPFAHEPGDLVADGPGATIELDRSGDQETTAAKDLALHVVEPCVREGEDLLYPAAGTRGTQHLVHEEFT